MNISRRFVSPIALAILIAAGAASSARAAYTHTHYARSYHARMHSARVSRDVLLMHRVEAALRHDRLDGAKAYTAAPGVIVLYGTVFDDHDRTRAEQAAKHVRGIHQVVDNLQTKTGQWMAEEQRIDLQLQQSGFNDVQARVIGPEVYLSGQVVGQAEKQRAAEVVASVSKKEINNMVWVQPGSVFGSIFQTRQRM
jgi:osmotically-inducible protein OsmY